MKQFFIKHFCKSECIKLFILMPDKRIKVRYVIPEGVNASVDGLTFNLVEDKMFYSKGIPTYICSYKSAEPINPNEINKVVMKPDDYNTAISAQVAKEIFSVTSNKVDMQLIAVALSVLCLLGIVFIYSSLTDSINQIINQLPQSTEPIITTTGGF